jgi:peptidoglycan/xylan/chitin deacetylase (PgdA/CDA1 family)
LHLGALAGAGAAWALAPEPYRWPAAGGVVLAHAALVTKGVWDPASSILCPTYSHGNDRTKLALTFDDGPGEATRQILGILRENRVSATFFVVGANVKGREDVLRSAVSGGHTIGTHSYSHSWLTNFFLAKAMREEIARGIEAVEKAVGKRPRLYRPPIGLKSPALARAARQLDLAVVGWRRKARDGRGQADAASIVGRLLKAKGGEVLLLHDGVEPGATSDRAATIAAVRELVPLLKARGFTFVTVDQLVGERPYA